MSALPTRHDEGVSLFRYWRHSRAFGRWRAEAIHVPPSESIARHVMLVGDAVAVQDYVIDIAAGGRCAFHILNAGSAALGRISLDVTLHEGAHFELGGVMIGAGEQTLEVVTTVTHLEPNATSNQVVRAVVGGLGTCNFLGSINVARDAQHTDAAQSVKAMLLSRTATANAVPQLEIFADDVKCAHGCAVGELDATAFVLFAVTRTSRRTRRRRCCWKRSSPMSSRGRRLRGNCRRRARDALGALS